MNTTTQRVEVSRSEEATPHDAHRAPGLSPKQAKDYLTPALQRTLGLIADADDGVAELTLVTLPYEGSLKTLDHLELVELHPATPAGRRILNLLGLRGKETSDLSSGPIELTITETGWQVIALCAETLGRRKAEVLPRDYEHLVDPNETEARLESA